MRIQLILNPAADRGRAAHLHDDLVAWSRSLGADHQTAVELVATETPGHAVTLAQIAADNGVDLVVAAGGDGTIHEVINGLINHPRQDVALGIVPIGSGNDFAYAMNAATDPKIALQRIFDGTARKIDLARITDDNGRSKIVMNGLGIGLDARIAIATRSIRWVHGFAMYLLATLKTIAFQYETPHTELWFDDEKVSENLLLFGVGVGPRIGGGYLLTPDATHDDGLLDSCLVSPVSRPTMLAMMTKVMKGTHITHPAVSMRRNREIMLKSSAPLPIHIDGEIFAAVDDNVRQVTISVLPEAIQIIS